MLARTTSSVGSSTSSVGCCPRITESSEATASRPLRATSCRTVVSGGRVNPAIGLSSKPTTVRYAAAGFLGAVRAWLLQGDGPDRPSAAELAASLVEVSARVLSPDQR